MHPVGLQHVICEARIDARPARRTSFGDDDNLIFRDAPLQLHRTPIPCYYSYTKSGPLDELTFEVLDNADVNLRCLHAAQLKLTDHVVNYRHI